MDVQCSRWDHSKFAYDFELIRASLSTLRCYDSHRIKDKFEKSVFCNSKNFA